MITTINNNEYQCAQNSGRESVRSLKTDRTGGLCGGFEKKSDSGMGNLISLLLRTIEFPPFYTRYKMVRHVYCPKGDNLWIAPWSIQQCRNPSIHISARISTIPEINFQEIHAGSPIYHQHWKKKVHQDAS